MAVDTIAAKSWRVVAVVVVMLMGAASPASAQHRRGYSDIAAGAVDSPQSPASITFPFFDTCHAGNEFEQRRCSHSRPSRRLAASRSLWRATFLAARLVQIGPYDFTRHRFPLAVNGIMTGPLLRQGVDTEGWFSTAPTHSGRLPASVLLRRAVHIGTADAEEWRRRNVQTGDLRVEVLFRVGTPWTDTLPGRYRVLNPRTRRYRITAGHARGMLMRVVGIKVFNAQTGEILAQNPADVIDSHTPGDDGDVGDMDVGEAPTPTTDTGGEVAQVPPAADAGVPLTGMQTPPSTAVGSDAGIPPSTDPGIEP